MADYIDFIRNYINQIFPTISSEKASSQNLIKIENFYSNNEIDQKFINYYSLGAQYLNKGLKLEEESLLINKKFFFK